MSQSLILYDGVCGLCNRLNLFVLKRDQRDHFRFASLQSSLADSILRRYQKDPSDLNTLYVITDFGSPQEKIWSRSGAAIRILARLQVGWKILAYMTWIVPSPIRDLGYRGLAAIRYRIFGKYDECQVPPKEWRQKFIEYRNSTDDTKTAP